MYRIALSNHTKPDTPVCNTTVEFHYWGKKGRGLIFLKKIFRSLSVYYTHRTERPVLLRNARAEHAAFSERGMRHALYCETHVRSAQHYYWLRNTRARLVLVFFFLLIKGVDLFAKGERRSPFQKSHLKKHFQSAFEHTFTKLSYQHWVQFFYLGTLPYRTDSRFHIEGNIFVSFTLLQ